MLLTGLKSQHSATSPNKWTVLYLHIDMVCVFIKLFFMIWFCFTADGLKHLRDVDIVHRDIKPGNIMRYLTEDGRYSKSMTPTLTKKIVKRKIINNHCFENTNCLLYTIGEWVGLYLIAWALLCTRIKPRHRVICTHILAWALCGKRVAMHDWLWIVCHTLDCTHVYVTCLSYVYL